MNLYSCAKANCFLFDNDNYDLNDDIIFLQYTGIKDKNGTEIYEGDIISYMSHKLTVFYDAYMILRAKDNEVLFPGNDVSFAHYSEHIEVLGNEYENKELLNGET